MRQLVIDRLKQIVAQGGDLFSDFDCVNQVNVQDLHNLTDGQLLEILEIAMVF